MRLMDFFNGNDFFFRNTLVSIQIKFLKICTYILTTIMSMIWILKIYLFNFFFIIKSAVIGKIGDDR